MPRSAPAQIFSRHWGPPRGCSVPGPCHGILFAFGFLAARESRSPSICGQPPGARGCRRASERECMVLQISQVSCTQGALRGGKTTTPPHSAPVHGPAVMELFGKSGLQGLPTRGALLRDIQLHLSQWGYWVPLITIWDPVAGPERTPKPGNNSGLSQALLPGLYRGLGGSVSR